MNDEQLQLVEVATAGEGERERITRGVLSVQALRNENAMYAGTPGVSRNNRRAGFVPAYRDAVTGRVVVSRFGDGRQAPVHLLDGLPSEWVAARDAQGRVVRVRAGVESGFLRGGRFYTREAALGTLMQ